MVKATEENNVGEDGGGSFSGVTKNGLTDKVTSKQR